MSREIITRRHLPHWYVPGAAHFVTYRLAGTVPKSVLQEIRERNERLLQQSPPAGASLGQFRQRIQKQYFAEYDRYLDRPSAIDWLMKPELAALIRGNLYHHADKKYHLLAYCIMPNHVHLLLQPLVGQAASLAFAQTANEAACPKGELTDGDSPLAEIMHSLKSFTAHRANKILGRTGPFWQHESYDHWVRDEGELERIVNYIIGNPVRAGLVKRPHDWLFGSALDRFLHDGSCCGMLDFLT